MRRNTQLPDGFAWRASGASRNDESGLAFLVYKELDIAVVRRMGNGWIAVIDSSYCSPESNSCIVPSLWKGQCWVAAWLRREAPTVHVLVKYHQPHNGLLPEKRSEERAVATP